MTEEGKYWSRVFLRKREVVARDIAGERLLVPIGGRLADLRSIFSLNPVAACIWDNIDGEGDVSFIRDAVLHRFDVGREEAEKDIREFIDMILDAGLIEEVP